jgi:TPR repeat protein
MRTSERTIVALALGAALLATPALAFDGSPVNQPPLAPPGVKKTVAAPATTQDSTIIALQYAAEGGHPLAQWKLGRMYADGDGVARNEVMAFDYFSRIASKHAEDNPYSPQSAVVANAFVALGRYYLSGIPNSKVTADPERAREMFYYAASYFGNADAQYDLARLYLRGVNASPDAIAVGVRWMGTAAKKGQHLAQAQLGEMLFNGDRMRPQRARGLMFLALACEGATPDEAWIRENYNRAVASSTEDERAMAVKYVEQWVQGRRD